MWTGAIGDDGQGGGAARGAVRRGLDDEVQMQCVAGGPGWPAGADGATGGHAGGAANAVRAHAGVQVASACRTRAMEAALAVAVCRRLAALDRGCRT
jgi:hypothetical protein